MEDAVIDVLKRHIDITNVQDVILCLGLTSEPDSAIGDGRWQFDSENDSEIPWTKMLYSAFVVDALDMMGEMGFDASEAVRLLRRAQSAGDNATWRRENQNPFGVIERILATVNQST